MRERAQPPFLTLRLCCSSPASRARFHSRRCEHERQGLSGEAIDINWECEFGHAVAAPFDAEGFRCRLAHASTSAVKRSWCRSPGANSSRRAHPQVVCNGPSPLHSPFPLGRALTVPAHLALHRKPRSARARCGRRLLLRPLVSGAPLPPPASPTASACKRPMTARPCPSHFAPPPSLSRLSSTSLHRRISTFSDASCRPKGKQNPPVVTAIDFAATRTVIGGVGGEERAPIDDLFDGLSRGGRQRPVPTAVEAVEPWSRGIRRRAGPSARTGEPDGRRTAGSARGRACDASTVVLLTPAQRKKRM